MSIKTVVIHDAAAATTTKTRHEYLSDSAILRKTFYTIRKRYSDGHNGRCAIGVIMSYHGWNGRDERGSAKKL